MEISDYERQLDQICLHIAVHLGVLTVATTVNCSHAENFTSLKISRRGSADGKMQSIDCKWFDTIKRFYNITYVNVPGGAEPTDTFQI